MSATIVLLSAFVFYFMVDRMGGRGRQHRLYSRYCQPPVIEPGDIVVYGRDLPLQENQLHPMLLRRFPYYQQLAAEPRQHFLFRLQAFLRQKIIIIKDDEGYQEMPVLVGAAAIQLTFGLPDFRFSFYRYLRIYPEAFFSSDFTRVLAGNVSSNTISVAWNHFLQGYDHVKDGSNVGLHEMSHALYFQKVEVEQNYAKNFTRRFQKLYDTCHQASATEKTGAKNLFSAYADSSLQEFWAESVELFFEKPLAVREHYPELFSQMVLLLNQDPLKAGDPVINRRKARPFFQQTLQSVTQARQRLLNRR